MENINKTEVCIIGAGAAGGILALELAQRGIKVIILDSGPRHDLSRRFEYVERFLRGENPWQSPLAELDRHTTGGSVPYRLEWQRARGVKRQHSPLGRIHISTPAAGRSTVGNK